MSSEIVAVPLLPLAVVGIGLAGVGMAGVGVARAVKAIVDKRVEAARRKMEAEKSRIREWQVFQAENRKTLEAMRGVQAAMREAEKKLAAIKTLQPVEERMDRGPLDSGYTSLGIRKHRPDRNLQSFFKEIDSVMIELPARFKEDERSPYQRLEKQRSRLVEAYESGRPPAIEEILTFKETVSRSCKSYVQAHIAAAANKEALSAALDTLLGDILVCRELSEDGKLLAELNSLREQILTLAESGDLKPGYVALLEERFREVRTAIEREAANSAYRMALAESLTRNLEEMGYETLEPFEGLVEERPTQTALRIPGGEMVTISVQPDNRIAFEVSHVGEGKADALHEADIAFFRQQERKWCGDFHALIRGLTQEGFQYEVKFERSVADDAIPVVVVETAEEILAMEEEYERAGRILDDPQKRYLT